MKKLKSPMRLKELFFTVVNTAFTSKYADPEKYHEYVLSRKRDTLGRHIAELFDQELGGVNDRRILDIGAGTGIIASALSNHGFEVTATDADLDMLATLHQKLPHVVTAKLDMNQSFELPDEHFHGVTSVWANRYIGPESLEQFLQEIHRILQNEGVFVWPIFTIEQPLWKLRAGILQPTSPRALARQLHRAGFREIVIDRTHQRRNRATKEVSTLIYPAYLIARK